jgi:KDO2-lipid IV(A) lauroyltransferase
MAAPKPSLAQDLAWRLEALAYDAVEGLARLFPIDAVSDFGAWLFARLGPLTGARRVAERNMRIAFPEAADAEIERLLAAQWEELGRWIAEFPILDRIVADPSRVRPRRWTIEIGIRVPSLAVAQTRCDSNAERS